MRQTWVVLLMGLFVNELSYGHYKTSSASLQTFEQSILEAIAAPSETQASKTPPPNGVALLLPLSGSRSSLGKQVLRGVHLALMEGPSKALRVWPVDTKSSLEGAESAAQEAIALGAQTFIGPIFAGEVAAITPLLRETHQVLTLSNNTKVAAPQIFIVGLSPREQTQRILTYALKQGHDKFLVLLPQNAYGEALRHMVEEHLQEHPNATLKLITYPLKDPEGATLQGWVQDINAFAPHSLYAPDGSPFTQKLLTSLKFHGMHFKDIQLLGSAQWDHPRFLRDLSFKGAWIPALRSKGYKKFRNRYQKLFGERPQKLAFLGHDLGLLLSTLLQTQNTLKPLPLGQKFDGTLGTLTLHPSGHTSRPWKVLKITGKKAKVIG